MHKRRHERVYGFVFVKDSEPVIPTAATSLKRQWRRGALHPRCPAAFPDCDTGCRSSTPQLSQRNPRLKCCTTCARLLRGKKLKLAAMRALSYFTRHPLSFSILSRRYFPATFDADGCFTHATGVASRLIETANHFYQGDPRPWVCLQTTRTKLRESGIFVQPAPPFSLLVCSLVAAASAPDSPPSQVRDERALPVAGQAARCGCLLRPSRVHCNAAAAAPHGAAGPALTSWAEFQCVRCTASFPCGVMARFSSQFRECASEDVRLRDKELRLIGCAAFRLSLFTCDWSITLSLTET